MALHHARLSILLCCRRCCCGRRWPRDAGRRAQPSAPAAATVGPDSPCASQRSLPSLCSGRLVSRPALVRHARRRSRTANPPALKQVSGIACSTGADGRLRTSRASPCVCRATERAGRPPAVAGEARLRHRAPPGPGHADVPENVDVLFNRHLVGRLRLSWNPERVGSYRLRAARGHRQRRQQRAHHHPSVASFRRVRPGQIRVARPCRAHRRAAVVRARAAVDWLESLKSTVEVEVRTRSDGRNTKSTMNAERNVHLRRCRLQRIGVIDAHSRVPRDHRSLRRVNLSFRARIAASAPGLLHADARASLCARRALCQDTTQRARVPSARCLNARSARRTVHLDLTGMHETLEPSAL